MNRISIISDRPDYHSVLVRDGFDIVELAGKHPWPTLFKAIVQLKLKQLRRSIHGKTAKREADNTHTHATILPLDRVIADARTIEFPGGKIARSVLPKPQLVLIQGQTVDELGSASSGSCGTEKEEARGGPGDQESDRKPAS
jgi:hypothetical protein